MTKTKRQKARRDLIKRIERRVRRQILKEIAEAKIKRHHLIRNYVLATED